MGQRVFFRVAAAEAPCGVDTHGREGGRGRVGRRNDRRLGGRRKREVPRSRVRV